MPMISCEAAQRCGLPAHRARKLEADAGRAALMRERLAVQLAIRQHDVFEVQRACVQGATRTVKACYPQILPSFSSIVKCGRTSVNQGCLTFGHSTLDATACKDIMLHLHCSVRTFVLGTP